jgi:hypothetical protein
VSTPLYNNFDLKKASILDSRLAPLSTASLLPDLNNPINFLFESAEIYIKDERAVYKAKEDLDNLGSLKWYKINEAEASLVVGTINYLTTETNLDLALVTPDINICKAVIVTVIGGPAAVANTITNFPVDKEITFYVTPGQTLVFKHTDYDVAGAGDIVLEIGFDFAMEGRVVADEHLTLIKNDASIVQVGATQFTKTAAWVQLLNSITVIDNLTSTNVNAALSANQGRILDEKIATKNPIFSVLPGLTKDVLLNGTEQLSITRPNWLSVTPPADPGVVATYLTSFTADTWHYQVANLLPFEKGSYVLPPGTEPDIENWVTLERPTSEILAQFVDTDTGIVIINTTYTDLLAAITAGTLVPGNGYQFAYETIHQIPNVTPNILNTAVLAPATETLIVTAATTSTLFAQAKSVTYPDDIIYYDVLDNTVLATSRPGYIYKRIDTKRNIVAPFDFREYLVARYPLELTSCVYTGGLLARGEITYNGTINTFRVAVTDDVAAISNYRLVNDFGTIQQTLYSGGHPGIQQFDGTPHISVNTSTTPTYILSIDTLSTNIVIKDGAEDILIDNCTDITLEKVEKVSLVNSTAVTIGDASANIIIKTSTNLTLKAATNVIHIDQVAGADLDANCSHIYLYRSARTKIGAGSHHHLISDSDDTRLGTETRFNLLIRQSLDNILDNNCSGITLSNSSRNNFEQGCSDIEIHGGGVNKFGANCKAIYFFGEGYNPAGGVIDAYTAYEIMAYNTFGSGCSNIIFYWVGGRGNQFGDECKNLKFTNESSPGFSWRLVGCYFVRGIQNKVFQRIVHGASFLVPDQVPVTITTNDWYAPMLWLNVQDNISVSNQRLLLFDNVPTDLITMGEGGPSTTSEWTGAVTNAAGVASNTLSNKFSSETNGYAFQWTKSGYPLSMTLIRGLNKEDDPTEDQLRTNTTIITN